MNWTWRKTRLLLIGLILLGPALLAVHFLWLPDFPEPSWHASYDRGKGLAFHGKLRLAEWHLQRALRQVEGLGPEAPERADTLLALAEVEVKQSRPEDAEPLLCQALAIREKIYGADSLALKDVLFNLGDIYINSKQWRKAAGVLERLLAVWSANKGPQSPIALTTAETLGLAYWRLGDFDRSRAVYESMRDTASDPAWKHRASIRLIDCCTDQGDWKAAEAAARNALQFLGEEPGYEERRGQVLVLLSRVFAAQKMYPQAQEAAMTALNLFRLSVASQELVAAALMAQACAQSHTGAFAQAVAGAKEAIDILERQPDADPLLRTAARAVLGNLYFEQGNYSKAVEVLGPALADCEKSEKREEGFTAGLLLCLGAAHFGQEDYSQAASLWARAIDIIDKTEWGETPPGKQTLLKAALSIRFEEYAAI
ncbi:MAG: tetratricopeptide repeat protein, partial [Planctomycetota bacterium]|nr:tetratricopeptide repeat protein [Planctomycetota bacterium]